MQAGSIYFMPKIMAIIATALRGLPIPVYAVQAFFIMCPSSTLLRIQDTNPYLHKFQLSTYLEYYNAVFNDPS